MSPSSLDKRLDAIEQDLAALAAARNDDEPEYINELPSGEWIAFTKNGVFVECPDPEDVLQKFPLTTVYRGFDCRLV